jgi:hypothetical protein
MNPRFAFVPAETSVAQFRPLGRANPSPLTDCDSLGYATSVGYERKWTSLKWVQKRTYEGIFGVRRAEGYLAASLRCNSSLVYIYKLPAFETETQGRANFSSSLPPPTTSYW